MKLDELKEKKIKKNVEIEENLHVSFEKLAKSKGVSFRKLLEYAMRKTLEEGNKK